MVKLMTLSELEAYISKDEELRYIYSGDYLPDVAKEWYDKEDEQTAKAAVEMAQKGAAERNVKKTFGKIEAEAEGLGLEVRYDVNKRKNEITVVFVDKKGKGVVASEKLGLGTAEKTLKTNMAAPKSFAPHRGDTLLTQTEEVALSFLETLKKTKQLSTNKIDKRDFLKTQLTTGKREAEMSVVTSESHSVIDKDEFNIEDMYVSSKAREAALHTKMRVGGIIGEVSKGVDFLSGLRKKKKITERQARAKNERIDQYLTRYVATYQLLGKRVAEDQLYNDLMNEELDLTEKQLKDKIAETEIQFGSFLKMRPTFGLSSDEAFKSKKFSYAGNRTSAFRSRDTTGRHLDQGKNYLQRSSYGQELVKDRLDEIFLPNGEKIEEGDTEHKLYSRALIEDEKDLLAALKQATEEEILERQTKLQESKKFQKMSQEQKEKALKKIEDDVRAQIPEVNATILEDMGLAKESVMKEQESWRPVTGVLTQEEYQKYEEFAIKDLSKQAQKAYNKLSREAKNEQTEEDFVDKYITSHKADLDRKIIERATGRKNLVDSTITQWETEGGEVGYDLEAKELVKGNVAKLLWGNIGLRETARGVNDRIFNRMAEILGLKGAEVIGVTKKIKAEEIPGYAQAILTQKIINSTNEEKVKIINKLQELGFKITETDGKYYVDNSMENVEQYDWEGLINYLTEDLKVFEEEIKDGEKTYKFAKNTKGFRSLQFMDVTNRADVWEPTKDVKVGYKEESAAFREISAGGLKGAEKEAITKDLKIIYDPTQGRTGAVAQKAQKDIDAILNKETGSIVQTYRSKTKNRRDFDIKALKGQNLGKDDTVDKDKTYVISIGNGSGYTINVNDLLKNKAVWDKEGGLSEEEYKKTIWGVIDSVKKEWIARGVPPENIKIALDPGTDFGFSMFDDGTGKARGAVGRVLYLPNIEADVRYDENGEAVYAAPEYSKDINSLIGSMKRGVAKSTIKPKVQAAAQSIFEAGQSEKSALGERADKKRVGASKAGKVTEISRSKINELLESGRPEDIEAAERLMSAVYVSRETGLNMLRDRDKYITTQDGKEVYNRDEHGAFLTEALRYLKGGDAIKELYGATEDLDEEKAKEKFAAMDDEAKDELINKLVGHIADAITDTSFSGKVKGLSGIANRFPSLQKHAALFGEMLIGGDLEAAEIRMGPAMTKILNGDYDGDTVNFILGLWSSGMSFDAAAKLVERQKRINRRFYDKMFKGTAGSDVAISGGDIPRLKDDSMGLSALATKFNKPFTGIFSNMSTRIREGLKALGRDYIDESGDVRDLDTVDDYVNAIETELVTAVGQILEQDSISAKKVDERIAKRVAENGGKDIPSEEKEKIQFEVLNEFQKLEQKIRNPETTYEEVINDLKDMGLLGGDMTQISASVTSIIEDLIDNISDDTKRKEVLRRVGLTQEELSSGKISTETYLKAGKYLESNLYDETGKKYKIFSGEYGSGLATSRMFTPFMKGDAYQMVKFLTETNDILRETGEIIDENRNKFNEYGETVGRARDSLEAEAAQESAKVVIAGKEGKAISNNVNTYKELSSKLEEAKDNYNAIKRLSVSEVKERLMPYSGMNTTGLDPKVLSDLISRHNAGEEFTTDDLIKLFGVEDEKTLKTLMFSALSTKRGSYIHGQVQGEPYGEGFTEIADFLNLFGYNWEEIDKTLEAYDTGASNLKNIMANFGTMVGGEIPIIGSDGEHVFNGRTDVLYLNDKEKDPFDESKTRSVLTIGELKTHANAELHDEDIVQTLMYKKFYTDLMKYVKDERKSGKSIDEITQAVQEQVRIGTKYDSDPERKAELVGKITPELIENILKADYIRTVVGVADSATGKAQAYLVGEDKDKYELGLDAAIGDLSVATPERRARIKNAAKKMTGAGYYRPGVEINAASGVVPVEYSAKSKKGESAESEAAEQKRNERLNEYIQLLKQEEEIKFGLAKIDRERKLLEMEGKTADSSEIKALEFQRSELEAAKTDIEAAKTDIEAIGFSEKDTARLERARATTRGRYSYMALKAGYTYDPSNAGVSAFEIGDDKLTSTETEDYASRLERLYNSRLSAEKEILTYKLKAQTTTGIESNNYRVLVKLKEEALKKDEESFNIIKAIVDKYAPERARELEEEYEARKKISQAEALKQTRGAASIWDVMANDIRRATMRIADFGIAAKLLNKIPQDIQKVIQYTKELDAAMTNIRIVSGKSMEEAQASMRGLQQIAQETGTTLSELASAANEWLDDCLGHYKLL